MGAKEVKDYLYNCLTDSQAGQLNEWIERLKTEGLPEKNMGIMVEVSIIPGTINPNCLPRAVSHVLEREQVVGS